MQRGSRSRRGRTWMYLPCSPGPLHKQTSLQPAQLAASWEAVRVPRCHYTAGDYQSTSLRRNLEAADMQGSEQNMDSLPLRHRSIAICNPSPAPPMTASFVRCSSQTEETQVPRSWKRAAAHRQAIHPPCLCRPQLSPPSSSLLSRLRLASHLASTTGPILALTPCHTNLMCPFRWQSHSSSSSRKRSKTTTILPSPRSLSTLSPSSVGIYFGPFNGQPHRHHPP